MSKLTHFLDLDKVMDDLADVTIKVDGEMHTMVHTTVETFIENTKLIQALQAGANDFEAEFKATVEMVGKAFPTLTVDRLMKMTFHQLNALLDAAKKYSGQTQIENETKPAATAEVAANPPAAAA